MHLLLELHFVYQEHLSFETTNRIFLIFVTRKRYNSKSVVNDTSQLSIDKLKSDQDTAAEFIFFGNFSNSNIAKLLKKHRFPFTERLKKKFTVFMQSFFIIFFPCNLSKPFFIKRQPFEYNFRQTPNLKQPLKSTSNLLGGLC